MALTNKKIAVIVSNDCSYDSRVLKSSKYLSSLGADVRIFAVKKQIDSNFDDELKILRRIWKASDIANDKLKLISHTRTRKKIVKKTLKYHKYFSFNEVLEDDVLNFKPDIVYAHDLITLPLGVNVKKKLGCKLVYDSHEYELHRNPPLTKLNKSFVYFLERYCFKKCDRIVTCSDSIGRELKEIYKLDDITIIYNTPYINPQPIKKQIRLDLGLNKEDLIALSVGKLTYNRGIEFVLEALVNLPNIHYVNVGPYDNTFKKMILQKSEELGIKDRFHILESVPYDQVVNYIRSADFGIVSVEPITKSYEYAMPNKLFELAFAGVPIIISDLPDASALVRKYKLGFVFKNRDIYGLKDCIRWVKKGMHDKDEQLFTEFYSTYSWEAQEKKLKFIFEGL